MRNILLIAIGGLILLELSKRSQQQTITPPPITRPPADYEKIIPAYEKPKMAGFYSSGLPGARPQHPFQVRWGDGNNFLDTTKKARLAL